MTRRSASSEYKHPATYTEIVEAAKRDHARRLAELKTASKAIVAIEPDLAALAAHKIYYSVQDYSMYMTDWLPESGVTTKKALRIRFSLFNGTNDATVSLLLERGWIVDDIKIEGRYSRVLLRRPKIRVRIELECSESLARKLSPASPVTEASE